VFSESVTLGNWPVPVDFDSTVFFVLDVHPYTEGLQIYSGVFGKANQYQARMEVPLPEDFLLMAV